MMPIETRRLKIGFVGMSNRATCFLDYLDKHKGEGKVVAICDIIPEKVSPVLAHYNLDCPVFSDYEEMIRTCDIDTLFITTPDSLHLGPVKAGLVRGMNVFCEKPMAITLEDCDEIATCAEKTNGLFYLGFNLRHGPLHRTVHDIVHRGDLGRITTIEANEYYYGGKTYFRRWNRLRELSGGLWITKASHDFDLLNWMADSEPVTVYATADLSYYHRRDDAANRCRDCALRFDCPDFYDIHLEEEEPALEVIRKMKLIAEEKGAEAGDLCLYNAEKDTFDNGIAVVTYKNGVRATYTVNVLAAKSQRQMRIVGTDGSLEADMECGRITVTQRHTRLTQNYDLKSLMSCSHDGSDDRMMQHFLKCIHIGEKAVSSHVEGRLSLMVGLAARQSMDTGEVVHVKTCPPSTGTK